MPKKLISFLFLTFLVFPASSTYKLDGYTFGGGGQMVGSSNYSVDAAVGEATQNLSGGSYDLGAGLVFASQASVPKTPTFNNPSNYYNKLHFILDNTDNPSDTLFAIAISSDNFVTTQYVKSDNTVGGTLALADYQDYTTWGGAGGAYVIGLDVGTSYSIKVKAMDNTFNESGWSSMAVSSTVNPAITFDIDVSATDQSTNPPYLLDMGDLIAGSVVTSSKRIWVSLDTNGLTGGNVYVVGQNGGLYSVTKNFNIGSTTADLGGERLIRVRGSRGWE